MKLEPDTPHPERKQDEHPSKSDKGRPFLRVPHLLQHVSNRNDYGRIELNGKIIRASCRREFEMRPGQRENLARMSHLRFGVALTVGRRPGIGVRGGRAGDRHCSVGRFWSGCVGRWSQSQARPGPRPLSLLRSERILAPPRITTLRRTDTNRGRQSGNLGQLSPEEQTRDELRATMLTQNHLETLRGVAGSSAARGSPRGSRLARIRGLIVGEVVPGTVAPDGVFGAWQRELLDALLPFDAIQFQLEVKVGFP